jgi:hypothetical protein
MDGFYRKGMGKARGMVSKQNLQPPAEIDSHPGKKGIIKYM